MKKLFFAASFAALAFSHAFAETVCHGTTLTGIVRDSTLALIPGAMITLDGNQNAESGSDGSFRFTCIGDGSHRLSVNVEGFEKRDLTLTTPTGGRWISC